MCVRTTYSVVVQTIGNISWSLDDGFFEIELHVLAGLRFEIKMEI